MKFTSETGGWRNFSIMGLEAIFDVPFNISHSTILWGNLNTMAFFHEKQRCCMCPMMLRWLHGQPSIFGSSNSWGRLEELSLVSSINGQLMGINGQFPVPANVVCDGSCGCCSQNVLPAHWDGPELCWGLRTSPWLLPQFEVLDDVAEPQVPAVTFTPHK